MIRYIAKRLLYSLPTLLMVSIISFFLSKASDNDPVGNRLATETTALQEDQYRSEYVKMAKSMGHDEADFYFSVTPPHYPATINQYVFPMDKIVAKKLLAYGYHHTIVSELLKDLASNDLKELSAKMSNGEKEDFEGFLARVTNEDDARAKEAGWSFPRLSWHGTDNQYHLWISNILKGNLGVSYVDGKPAIDKIKEALPYTLFMSLSTLLLSLMIGVGVARWIILKGQIDGLETFFYGLYAVPVFWLATMGLMFFTTDQYSSWLNWFPSGGIDYAMMGKSASYRFWYSLDRLILPIICLSLHSVAFIMLQMKSSLRKQQTKTYTLTAFAKGLNSRQVLDRHHFRNALTPLITMIVASLPSIFSGSLLVELIFNVPGMGRLMFYSIMEADWPVVFAIIMIVAVITLISYLIGDILYRKFDPKIAWN